MTLLLLAALALQVDPALPAAAAPASDDSQERIDELERRVDALSQALEASQQQRPSPAPGFPTAPTVAASTAMGMSPGAGHVYDVSQGLSFGGYGETLLSVYRQVLQNGAWSHQDSATDLLRGVLYVGYKFNDWLVFDSEYEFEHAGFTDEHPQGEAIVEFAFLDFLIHPAVGIRAGHVLLPIGFINELHEPPIFLGAQRPALEREGGVIPTTWHENGFGLHGSLAGQLFYKLYVTNGLSATGFNSDGSGGITGGRQDGHQAIANQPAFSGRLDWRGRPGLLLGVSGYLGNSQQARGAEALWTTLVEAHAEYRGHGLQARAIFVHLNNRAPGVEALDPSLPGFAEGTEQVGGYGEVGFDVLSLWPQIRQQAIPFIRVERFNTQQAVATGAAANAANDQAWIEMGANYLPIPQVAIKADCDVVLNAASTGRSQFNLALSYLF